MLKSTVILLTIFGVLLAAPVEKNVSKIVKYEFVPNSGDGSYKFRYETSDGSKRYEEGRIVQRYGSPDVLYVNGFYSYQSDKGEVKRFYEADEDGYREGAEDFVISETPQHLPAALIGSLVGGGLG